MTKIDFFDKNAINSLKRFKINNYSTLVGLAGSFQIFQISSQIIHLIWFVGQLESMCLNSDLIQWSIKNNKTQFDIKTNRIFINQKPMDNESLDLI